MMVIKNIYLINLYPAKLNNSLIFFCNSEKYNKKVIYFMIFIPPVKNLTTIVLNP